MTRCIVREETPLDHNEIAAVTHAAFGGRQVEVDLIDAIRNSDDYVSGLSLVAELDGVVVGHCILGRKYLAGKAAPAVLELGPLTTRAGSAKALAASLSLRCSKQPAGAAVRT